VAWRLKREVELLNRDGTPMGRADSRKAASSASGAAASSAATGKRMVKRKKRGLPSSHTSALPHVTVEPPVDGREGCAPAAANLMNSQAKFNGEYSAEDASLLSTRPERSRVSTLAQNLIQTYYRNTEAPGTVEAMPANNVSSKVNTSEDASLKSNIITSVASTTTKGEQNFHVDGTPINKRSSSNGKSSERSRPKERSRDADLPLRVAADDALARLSAQLKKPLSQDERNVLRSAEVLIWSYVATMQDLSTRVLRETADPPVPADLNGNGSGGSRAGSDGSGSTDDTGGDTTADGGSDNDSDYEAGKERKKSRKRGRTSSSSRPSALHKEVLSAGRRSSSSSGGGTFTSQRMGGEDEPSLDERPMVGQTLRKAFPPLGTFRGRIVGRGLPLGGGVQTWRVAYEDGDAEDLPWRALAPLLDPTAEWSTKAAAAAANVVAAPSLTDASGVAPVPLQVVFPRPELTPQTSMNSSNSSSSNNSSSDRGVKRSHSFPNESSSGRRPRNARVRRATSFLDPHEQRQRDKAAAAELAKKESMAKAEAGEMGTLLKGGNGTTALTWKDGLVAHGYYDLVPKQLAKGLSIECGRVVRSVQWGAQGCTVTSIPLRPGGGGSNDGGGGDGAKGDDDDDDDDDESGDGNEEDSVDDEQEEEEEEEHDQEGSVSSTDPMDESERSEQAKAKARRKTERKSSRSSSCVDRSDESDFVVVALPLGVLKQRHAQSTVQWEPPLPPRKQEAFEKLGFGTENKIVLRFQEVFWDAEVPYLQTVDERFRILNGLCFGKGQTLVFHCSPPFGNGYSGLTEDRLVVAEALTCLKGMYGAGAVDSSPLVFSHVTRWDLDPFSMGAYSYWATGAALQHVLDAARPEPDPQLPRASTTGERLPPGQSNRKGVVGNGGAHGSPGYGSTGSSGSKVVDGGGGDYKDGRHSGGAVTPRLFFCGEHATIRDAQCVHGACNSGERAGRQVACAALGFLGDLKQCVAAGETYWYAPPPPLEPAEARRVGDFASSNSLQQTDAHNKVSPDVPAEVSALAALPALTPSSAAEPAIAAATSLLKEALTLSGRSLLLDPTYSPFPTAEAVAWYKSQSSSSAGESSQRIGAGSGKVGPPDSDDDWLFACPCGVEGRGYDDGGAMVQCDDCESWQHQACVALYATSNLAATVAPVPPVATVASATTMAAPHTSSNSTSGINGKSSTGSKAGACELCKVRHDGSYGSGRFCSQACRNRANGGKGGQSSQNNNKSSSSSAKRASSISPGKASVVAAELIHRCHRCDPKRFRGCPASAVSSNKNYSKLHGQPSNNVKLSSAFGVAQSVPTFPSADAATGATGAATAAAVSLPLRAAWEHSGLNAAAAAAALVAGASELAVQQSWARCHLRAKESGGGSLLAPSNPSDDTTVANKPNTLYTDTYSSKKDLESSPSESEIGTALGFTSNKEFSSRGKSIASLETSLPKANGSHSSGSNGVSKANMKAAAAAAATTTDLTWDDVEWSVLGTAMTDETADESSETEAEIDGSPGTGDVRGKLELESTIKEPLLVRSTGAELADEDKDRHEAEPSVEYGSRSTSESEHMEDNGDGIGIAKSTSSEDGDAEHPEGEDEEAERGMDDASDHEFDAMPGEGPAKWAGLLGAYSATRALLSDAAQSVMAAGWQSAVRLAAARKAHKKKAISSSASASLPPGSSNGLRTGSNPPSSNSSTSGKMKVSLQRRSWPPLQSISAAPAAPCFDSKKSASLNVDAGGYTGAPRNTFQTAPRPSKVPMRAQPFAPAKLPAMSVNRSAFVAPFQLPRQGQMTSNGEYDWVGSTSRGDSYLSTHHLRAESGCSMGLELSTSAAVWSPHRYDAASEGPRNDSKHWHWNGSSDSRHGTFNGGSRSSHSGSSRTSGVGSIDTSASVGSSSGSVGSGITDMHGSYDKMELHWMAYTAVKARHNPAPTFIAPGVVRDSRCDNYPMHAVKNGSPKTLAANSLELGLEHRYDSSSNGHLDSGSNRSLHSSSCQVRSANPPNSGPLGAPPAETSTMLAPVPSSSTELSAAPPAAAPPPAESLAASPIVLSAALQQKPSADFTIEPLALTSLSQNHWAASLVSTPLVASDAKHHR